MKINECAVIDNKVIDELIAECENKSDNIFITESLSIFMEGQLNILKHIKSQLIPLEPIVRDAYNSGVDNTSYDSFEDCYDIRITAEEYINQTEI